MLKLYRLKALALAHVCAKVCSVALWGASVAGIWVFPLRILVVVTGASVCVALRRSSEKQFLIRALADVAQVARSRHKADS